MQERGQELFPLRPQFPNPQTGLSQMVSKPLSGSDFHEVDNLGYRLPFILILQVKEGRKSGQGWGGRSELTRAEHHPCTPGAAGLSSGHTTHPA